MGKHKPIYDPSFVVGDFVVVVNAEKSAPRPAAPAIQACHALPPPFLAEGRTFMGGAG